MLSMAALSIADIILLSDIYLLIIKCCIDVILASILVLLLLLPVPMYYAYCYCQHYLEYC